MNQEVFSDSVYVSDVDSIYGKYGVDFQQYLNLYYADSINKTHLDESIYLSYFLPNGNSAKDTLLSSVDVFGENSVLSAEVKFDNSNNSVKNIYQDNFLIDIFSLISFMLFAYLMYRFRPMVIGVSKAAFNFNYYDKIIELHSFNKKIYYSLSGILYYLTLTLIVNDFVRESTLVSKIEVAYLPLIILAFLLFVSVIRIVILRVVGYVSQEYDFISNLSEINLLNKFFYSLFIVLPVIVLTVSNFNEQQFANYAVWTLFIFSVLHYIFKSFHFFVTRKVSLLLWILYLCTVEIFPITFIGVLFYKGLNLIN